MSRADQVIAELGRAQHSVLLGSQAVAQGVTRRQLRYRLEIGRLAEIGPDLYLVGGATLTWEGKLRGMALTADGALVSHRSAAALWGFDGFKRTTLEITVRRGDRLRRSDAVVHESTDLHLAGRRHRNGLPLTDPARTLLDLARRLDDDQLTRAIESARRLRLTTWSELIACLSKHARPGRPGIRRLRGVIARGVEREEVTDSDFELLVHTLLVEHGLPVPVIHHVVTSRSGRVIAEVDLAYPDLRVAIELDGGDHLRHDVFERDRPRQNDLVLDGWVVLRFTWAMFRDQPDQLVASVRSALALRSAA